MIFIRQFAVLELNRLALGQKRDLYRVFAGSIIGQSASSLCLFFCHDCSCISPMLLCVFLCLLWLGFENLNHRGHRVTQGLFEFCLRHGVRRGRAFAQIGLVHVLAFQRGRDGGVHHHFRQSHRSLVQRINRFANRLVILFGVHRDQRLFHLGDLLLFLGRQLSPSCALLTFFEGSKDCRSLAARFDQLAPAEVFFRVVERVENHAFDLLVGETVARLYLNLCLFAAALLASGDVQNSVGVDQGLDLGLLTACRQ